MLAEMESLQSQIQQAKHATEINNLTAENLKREVCRIFYFQYSCFVILTFFCVFITRF